MTLSADERVLAADIDETEAAEALASEAEAEAAEAEASDWEAAEVEVAEDCEAAESEAEEADEDALVIDDAADSRELWAEVRASAGAEVALSVSGWERGARGGGGDVRLDGSGLGLLGEDAGEEEGGEGGEEHGVKVLVRGVGSREEGVGLAWLMLRRGESVGYLYLVQVFVLALESHRTATLLYV